MGGSFYTKDALLSEVLTDPDSEVASVISKLKHIGYGSFNIHEDLECNGIYFYLVATHGEDSFPVDIICGFRFCWDGAECTESETTEEARKNLGEIIITNDELSQTPSAADI